MKNEELRMKNALRQLRQAQLTQKAPQLRRALKESQQSFQNLLQNNLQFLLFY